MVDQASMKANGPTAPSARVDASSSAPGGGRLGGHGDGVGPADVASNVAEFTENLLTLAELQAKMAAIELKQNLAAIKVGTAVLAGGAVLSMAALAIALAGIAELLVSLLGWNRGLALLTVAVATLSIAGAGIAVAIARLRGSDLGFPLSREEFARNLNWVRTVLLYSGRSARTRRSR
jgi:hypothetical protein